MKKLYNLIEERPLSTLEIVLAISTAFFGGMILGVFFSPKGKRQYGCNNGNDSGNYYGNKEEDDV